MENLLVMMVQNFHGSFCIVNYLVIRLYSKLCFNKDTGVQNKAIKRNINIKYGLSEEEETTSFSKEE